MLSGYREIQESIHYSKWKTFI